MLILLWPYAAFDFDDNTLNKHYEMNAISLHCSRAKLSATRFTYEIEYAKV